MTQDLTKLSDEELDAYISSNSPPREKYADGIYLLQPMSTHSQAYRDGIRERRKRNDAKENATMRRKFQVVSDDDDDGALEDEYLKKLARSLVSKKDYLTEQPSKPEALVGDPDDVVIWALYQAFASAGDTGSFKTWLNIHLGCGLAGYVDEVFGLPVRDLELGNVGYLGWDRPDQIEPIFGLYSRELGVNIGERVNFMPPDRKMKKFIMEDVEGLRKTCEWNGWEAVLLDSLKDFVGWKYDEASCEHLSDAMKECAEYGIQIASMNHNTKAMFDRGTRYSGQPRGPQLFIDSMGSSVSIAIEKNSRRKEIDPDDPTIEHDTAIVQVKTVKPVIGMLDARLRIHTGRVLPEVMGVDDTAGVSTEQIENAGTTPRSAERNPFRRMPEVAAYIEEHGDSRSGRKIREDVGISPNRLKEITDELIDKEYIEKTAKGFVSLRCYP